MATFKVLGTTGDVTTCDNCGKSHLKKTVALDNGEKTVFFGVDSAARAIRGKSKTDKIKNADIVTTWGGAMAVQFAKDNLGKLDPKFICERIRVHWTNAWVEKGCIFIAITREYWEQIEIGETK